MKDRKIWIEGVDRELSNLRYENKEMQELIYGLFQYIYSVTENYGDKYKLLENKAVEMNLTLPSELRLESEE
jgi:hypothetical protein